MPRQLAIWVFTAFVIWLWRTDAKSRPKFSKALWIPFIWILILATHPLSWWTSFFFGFGDATGSNLEGNPLNRSFYSFLILVSIVIVSRRGLSWGLVARYNVGLALFFFYLALSVLWSDFPIATTKRWIKEVGAIPVLLVILTEDKPLEAIKTVFTRAAFVVFSYSVLAIKYIPEIGRSYASHSGGAQILGICDQKNSLGEISAACGVILLWQLLDNWPKQKLEFAKTPFLQLLITFVMGVWLLYQCDSKTSILCLGIGTVILVSKKIPILARRPTAIIVLCMGLVPLYLAADNLFNVSYPILRMLGRDPTLTNRTEIWEAVKQHPVDPILGCGFLNYWDKIGPIVVGQYEVTLKTAHNGYLEVFLDGGVIGIGFLAVMLVHAGIIQAKAFLRFVPGGAVALAVFCMTAVANITESLYARRTPLWIVFILFLLYTSNAVASQEDIQMQKPVNEDTLGEQVFDIPGK